MKTLNKKYFLIILCGLFLLTGLVLLLLYFYKNISEYLPMTFGLTNLMYLPIFLRGSLSAFASGIIILILLLIEIESNISEKVVIPIVVLCLVIFFLFNTINILGCYNSFEEETYFSAMDDMDNMLPPDENIAEFFPFYDNMESVTKQTPYYAFSKYELNNTIYEITQVECNDYENFCSFTAEYFETDKSYLLGKFISEKKIHYSSDENGEPLNSSLIKRGSYNNFEYDLIEQLTEKIIIISADNYYFLFHYQDSMKVLNISTEQFINTAFQQFDLLKKN